MTIDEIMQVIELLQEKHDKKRDEASRYMLSSRGDEAFGFTCGLSFAIGALEACISD